MNVALGVDLGSASAQDPSALALRRTAPHAMLDPVPQRVLEALGLHGTGCADTTCTVDANSVRWKEEPGFAIAAKARQHPRVFGVVLGNRCVVHAYR